MNETLQWAAARILFVFGMTLTLVTATNLGAATREIDNRITVLAILICSLVTWAGFMTTYMTRKAV